jgi:predicted lipoprotein with Yx(FWY)xxD motif
VIAAVTALSGCGSSSSSADDQMMATQASSTTTHAAASARGPKLKIVDSDDGRILANGRGRALYLFTADHGKASNCSGDRATAWPPSSSGRSRSRAGREAGQDRHHPANRR